MHLVQQILEATAVALQANAGLSAIIETNRVRSLSEDQAELPAVTVNYGADSPEEGDQENFGSALEMEFAAYCAGDSETEVLLNLIEMRTQCHISVMAAFKAGSLPGVWDIAYGGADKPLVQQAERMSGAQTCRWSARYRMDNDDPQ